MLDFPSPATTNQVYGQWQYDGAKWIPAPGVGGISEAPNDATLYGRKSQAWAHPVHTDITDWAAQASSTTPVMNGPAAVGTGTTWARSDHVHPSDTTLLPLAGGTVTGALQVNGWLTSAQLSCTGPVAMTALQTSNPGSNQIWNNSGIVTIGAGTSYLPASGGVVTGPVDLRVQSVTAAASTTINRASGENVALTLGASITTLTISGWPASGTTGKVRLVIVSSGAFTIAWPAGTKWAGGTAPTLTSSGTDIVILMTDNAGGTIYGSVVGQAYA